MIEEAIRNFPKQFAFEPEIKNAEKLKPFESIVIGGMGGSGLVAGILRALKPELDVAAHHEYGLPAYLMDSTGRPREDANKHLFIASSYSGNTEETIDFFAKAIEKELNVAVIAVGGKLLELAKEKDIPSIQLPDTGIQPRMGLGFMLQSVLKLIGENSLYEDCKKLADILKPEELKLKGKELSEVLMKRIPVVYASRQNLTLAYNWKIKFNEGSKIPAFYNTFPEVNHNEMAGFDVVEGTRELSEKIHFIFINDSDDHPRIKKRMEVLEKLYHDRNLPVVKLELNGVTRPEKIFRSLLLADFTAYHLALKYDVEPEQVPMVEEFKKLINAKE